MSEDNASHLKQLLASLSRPAVIMGPGAASPHPTTGPMEALPAITQPEATVRALIEFFEIHQILMRDDFVKLLKKTQEVGSLELGASSFDSRFSSGSEFHGIALRP